MRTIGALLVAALVNLLLFAALMRMIEVRDSGLPEDFETLSLDVVRLDPRDLAAPPEEPEPEQEELADEPELEAPRLEIHALRPAPTPQTAAFTLRATPIAIQGAPFVGVLELGAGGSILVGGGGLRPIVHVPPQYPPRAQAKGIEGVVVIEFTITKDGATANLEITHAEPPRIFNRAALRAVRRWRYDPQLEDGRTVEPRVRVTVEFEMDES